MTNCDTLIEDIRQDITQSSNDDLAKDQHVIQLWNDGEITQQKADDLLWQRTLHQIDSPLTLHRIMVDELNKAMPHKYGKHRFIFTTLDDAKRIRNKIKQAAILLLQYS